MTDEITPLRAAELELSAQIVRTVEPPLFGRAVGITARPVGKLAAHTLMHRRISTAQARKTAESRRHDNREK